MDNTLFNYINESENNNFSKLEGLDLLEFLELLDKYYLTLRSSLGLSSDMTFGLEIEFEHIIDFDLLELENYVSNYNYYTVIDRSLDNGREVISPILRDNVDTWKNLENICMKISNYGSIGTMSASHVHIGSHILGCNIDTWNNLLKIWSTYENIIYRFLYGEFLNHRPAIMGFANSLSSLFRNYLNEGKLDYSDISELVTILSNKEYAIRVNNEFSNINEFKEYNTFEFRSPNGTLNPVIWQNNVNLLSKILLRCKSNLDNDLLNSRLKKINHIISNINWYREIYLDQALEFSDLIFDNNLDKVYFLRQYLKSFEVSEKPLTRAKRFTR